MSSVYEVINPATEKVVKAIELADEAATDAAIELKFHKTHVATANTGSAAANDILAAPGISLALVLWLI